MYKKPQFSDSVEVNDYEYTDEKRVRFDDENIRLTDHPIIRDYGFMTIPESKTPFPRHIIPLDDSDLYNSLQSTLDLSNSNGSNSYGLDIPQSPITGDACSKIYSPDRKDIFNRKRKQFDRSEYTITKQKIMSAEICEAGSPIANNWCIINNRMELLSSRPSLLNSFLSSHRLPSQITFVNRATLLEIAEQNFHIN